MAIDFNNLDNQSKAILLGLFLSKYDKKTALSSLGFSTYTEAYNVIGQRLGVSPSSIQIHRNKFDTFIPNERKGFRFNKERGDLVSYEKWVEKTQDCSFEEFLSIFKSILDIYGEHKFNWEITKDFERISEAYNIAFGKMLKNSDELICNKLSSIEREIYYNETTSEYTGNIVEEDKLMYIESFLSGLNELFEINGEKHFSRYKKVTLKLYDFIREYWNEENLQLSKNKDFKWLNDYYNFYNYYYYDYAHDYQREALRNMRCDSLSIISSHYIIVHLRDAFALSFLQGETYDLERILVNRALSVLDNKSLLISRIQRRKFHEMTHALHEHVKDELVYILVEPLPSNWNQQKKNRNKLLLPTKKVKEGALYAELAYYLFGSKKKRSHSNSIQSYALTTNKYSIDGDFSFPCELKGYLAKTNKGDLILGFKGTKFLSGTNWTTNRLQLFIGPETCYLCALGLLLELCGQTTTNQSINVYGHSLGGGLTQFAVAAVTRLGHKNVSGFCYNSAGLGKTSLRIIYSINQVLPLNKNISHLFHQSDIVHTLGYLLGRRYYIGINCKMLNMLILPAWYFHRIDTIISKLGLSKRKMVLIK